MKRANVTHIAAALAALFLTGAAHGQYVWLDDKGVKQYSDMPPPASVPMKRILRQPGQSATPQPAVSTSTPSASTEQASGATGKVSARTQASTAEREADFRKRRAEQGEKERKAAEEERLAADKAKHCERAREYQRALQSGDRIGRIEKNGERSFLTDEQRAHEANEVRRTLENCA